jgi:hypothetical protein
MLAEGSAVDPSRRAALAAALGCVLFLAYLLTFSGIPNTGDERFIIDTTDSLAIHGSLMLHQTAYISSVQITTVEPAQPILSVPLYWLAYHIPWVGNVHALYLFSPIVTALTAIILYYYSLDLGYPVRTALIASLLFGLTTIVWPYSQTYFREPLAMLTLFAAAFLIQRWRTAFISGQKRQWLYLAAAVVVALLALLTKEAILVALPALLLLAYPGGALAQRTRRRLLWAVAGIVVIAVLFAVLMAIFREQFVALDTRYNVLQRLETLVIGLPRVLPGIAGYLISPGRAIWWYSPVALLALGAPAVLPRRRWRETWLPLGLGLLFAVSYAAVRGEVWFGGTGWGTRYMVPLVPFLIVGALPLIDRILKASQWWPRLALAGLASWGFVVQGGGTYVNILNLDAYIEAGTGQPPWLGPAIWSFRWSHIGASLRYLPDAPPNIVWLIPTPDWLAIGVILAAMALCAACLVMLHRANAQRRRLSLIALSALPVLVAGVTVFVLWRAYDDPRYKGDREDLAALREYLAAHVDPRDPIVLSSPSYVDHFMNYYKGQALWYSAPIAPGERYTEDQQPAVVSDDPRELIGDRTANIVNSLRFGGIHYTIRPIWLVSDLSPWLGWPVLAVERYLAKFAFLSDEVELSPHARVIRVVSLEPPLPDDPPEVLSGALLGEGMRLIGADVVTDSGPDRTGIKPGDMLGVSLLWQADTPIPADYTVSVRLIAPDGSTLAQTDRTPASGFAPTSTWEPGEPLRDNYGFTLPPDALPGQYQVWVLAYAWPSLEALPITAPNGGPGGDYIVVATFDLP